MEESDYEGAEQALGRAIDIARREGDLHLEAQTLAYAAIVSGQQLHWQESVDHGLRAIELPIGDENPFSARRSRFSIVSGLLRMGDLDAARPHALALRDMAERRSTPRSFAVSFFHIALPSLLEGSWKAVREYSERGLERAPLHPMLLVPLVRLEYETGESAQGEVYLERLLEVRRQAAPGRFIALRTFLTITAIARITGVPGHLEIAEAAAEAVLSAPTVTPHDAMDTKAGFVLLAVQKGDQSAAEDHYPYLQGQRGTMIETVSSVDRLLGLLSQTMGNLDQAASQFEDALTFCRKAGYRPELAWACCDYADALRHRDEEGDRAKAMSLLDESLAISSELGMRPLMERVTERLERIQARPSTAPAYPDGLTQREVEVLRLVAAGKTDREIGEELSISVSTASTHVRNILNKTNVANRTEATAYAARLSLI